MKIEHLALWTLNLEEMRQFYEKYFKTQAGDLYHNPKKGFYSYFLTFESGPRLEIMARDDIKDNLEREHLGYAHLAISLGSEEQVDALTEQLDKDGYSVVSPTRWTGDGYYESVVLDPEGNRIELTV